jgi:hypothetical protein
MDMTIEFIQDGSQITGSFTSEMGKWEISEGILSGKELSFSISADIMGQSMAMEFSGTVDNESLEGDISFQDGSATLKATKIPDEGVEESSL